jgi:hypothetical protein
VYQAIGKALTPDSNKVDMLASEQRTDGHFMVFPMLV